MDYWPIAHGCSTSSWYNRKKWQNIICKIDLMKIPQRILNLVGWVVVLKNNLASITNIYLFCYVHFEVKSGARTVGHNLFIGPPERT